METTQGYNGAMDEDISARERSRLGQWMIVAMWIGVLLVLTMGFGNWLERERNPNRQLSSRTSGGVREVALRRNREGHYVASGTINGHPVVFLLDTGASDVSVAQDLARQLGLRRGAPLTMQTAGGLVTGYATRLDSVRLGDIEQRGVRASINPQAVDDQVLLGMSFLRHLEMIQQGDTLTLRQYAGVR